jgi:hypothetical protein
MLLSSKLGPMKLGVVVVMLLASAIATAQDRPDLESEMERTLAHPAPLPGLERAHVGPPRWCGHLKERDDTWAGTFVNDMQDYRGSHYSQSRLFNGARLVCNAPNRPAAAHAAAEVLQYWINETGLSEQDAIASLAARFDDDAWTAAHDQLCSALESDARDDDDDGYDGDSDSPLVERAGGRRHRARAPRGAHHLAEARKLLLGCSGEPMWLRQQKDLDGLMPFIDRGPIEQDPLARAAWILARTSKALEPGMKNALVGYVADQFVLHTVTTDQLMRALDVAPLKGNPYARAIVVETSGAVRLAVARYEAAIAAKTSDPAWRELLVTAPQRGAAAWRAAADKYKDALAHADAFEAARGPGCRKQLSADFQAILKKLKHGTLHDLQDAISDDPIAGLLMYRLIECLVDEGEHGAAQTFDRMLDHVRVMQGPIMAAYYAALDALDKSSLRVQPSDLPNPSEPMRGSSHDIDESGTHSVIASVTKTATGVHVSFVKTRVQEMSQKCVETNKPDRVMPDGKIIYRTVCHDTGLVWADTTPLPVDVRTPNAAALQPGRYAKFIEDLSSDVVPLAVFGDKQGKHLIAFAGLVLE